MFDTEWAFNFNYYLSSIKLKEKTSSDCAYKAGK